MSIIGLDAAEAIFYIAFLGVKKSDIGSGIACFYGIIQYKSIFWAGPTPNQNQTNEAISEGDPIYVIDPNLCTECVGFYDEP